MSLLLCLTSGHVHGAPICVPAVQVEGEPALREPVASGLRRRGVSEEPPAGCPITRVVLNRREALISVSLSEESRRARRVVADTDTAISVIESWVRSDLSAPLLLALLPQEPVPPPPPPLPPPAPPASVRAHLALFVEAGGGMAGGAWLGGGLRACAELRRVCVGGAWRIDGDVGGDANGGRRITTELLATAALPLQLGPLILTLSLGLGVAWARYSAEAGSLLPRSGGQSGSESGESTAPLAASVRADTGGLRAEARVELAVPLPRGLFVFAAVALDAALTGRDGPLVTATDPSGESVTAQLPGLPWALALGQVGLRWSSR